MLAKEEVVGLLSLNETEPSYLIEGVPAQTVKHMLNICHAKRLRFIHKNGTIMFDCSEDEKNTLDEMGRLLKGIPIQEATTVPEILKNEFYRLNN